MDTVEPLLSRFSSVRVIHSLNGDSLFFRCSLAFDQMLVGVLKGELVYGN
jgi:hypothetical protein